MKRLYLAAGVAAALLAGSARAQGTATGAEGPAPETPIAAPAARPISYALIVGSNAGGPGQQKLRYAQTDAQRVAEVLTTLGGYDPERVTRLLQPSSSELFGALEQLGATLQAHAQAGEATRFFFYYSGHARADALNVGEDRIALSELRERILGLPATLSIVVLDACQSGSFSRAKGVSKAQDFSFNSVGELSTEGVAVIASSTGQELSQESDDLSSGHFTHHLLVALRGAGDINGDGAVTLSEAYEYAYGRTLSSTAVTQVGEQHVTLETELTGHGDVALTRPVDASAHVIIPKPLTARVLLQQLPSFSVAAELDKAAGEAVSLAFPPGRYAATVRLGDRALRCPLILREGESTVLALEPCKQVELSAAMARGGSGYASPPPARSAAAPRLASPPGDEGWFLEVSLGSTRYRRSDAYHERVYDFGYVDDPDAVGGIDAELAIGRRLHRNFAVGLGYFDLDALRFKSSFDEGQTFELDAAGAWAFAQGDLPLDERRLLNLFARAGVGYAFADSTFKARPILPQGTRADDIAARDLEDVDEGYGGALLAAALGTQLNFSEHFGVQLLARYTYAPIIDNELGDTHDVGGLSVMLGLRFCTWEAP